MDPQLSFPAGLALGVFTGLLSAALPSLATLWWFASKCRDLEATRGELIRWGTAEAVENGVMRGLMGEGPEEVGEGIEEEDEDTDGSDLDGG